MKLVACIAFVAMVLCLIGACVSEATTYTPFASTWWMFGVATSWTTLYFANHVSIPEENS